VSGSRLRRCRAAHGRAPLAAGRDERAVPHRARGPRTPPSWKTCALSGQGTPQPRARWLSARPLSSAYVGGRAGGRAHAVVPARRRPRGRAGQPALVFVRILVTLSRESCQNILRVRACVVRVGAEAPHDPDQRRWTDNLACGRPHRRCSPASRATMRRKFPSLTLRPLTTGLDAAARHHRSGRSTYSGKSRSVGPYRRQRKLASRSGSC
jgi:hypothetical protein